MIVLCALRPSYLVLTIILAFFLVVSMCLITHFWYSMWRTQNTSELLRFYRIAIIVSNCLFCFYIIVSLAQAVILGTCDWDTYVFWSHFSSPSYFYGVTLLLWIFIKRLKHVVHESIFELSKCVYIYFQIIVVTIFCMVPGVPTAWIYIPDSKLGGEIALTLGLTCFGLYFINSIFAMGLFINKFGQIIGLMASGDVTDTHQKKLLQSAQRIVRRQTLLITIALSSTMCVTVVNIIWFYLFYWNLAKYDYITIWQCIDSVIGIICINVQFEHGGKFYSMCRLDKLETKIDEWILCFNKQITLNSNMTKSINDSIDHTVQYKSDLRAASASTSVTEEVQQDAVNKNKCGST